VISNKNFCCLIYRLQALGNSVQNSVVLLTAYAMATILLVACFTTFAQADNHQADQAPPGQAQSAPESDVSATPVRTVTLETVMIRTERSAPARVFSLNQAKIAAEISARIVSIDVEAGDSISTGKSLATLDCSDFDRARAETNARLDAGQSRLRLAEQQLERTRRLIQSRTVSDDALDRNQAEYDSALAEIAAQRAMLSRADNQASRCQINAPFDGVVSQRYGQIGEFTSPGSVLLQLVDTVNVELSAQIPDRDVDTLPGASEAAFVYGIERFPVSVRTILPIVDEMTQSREARLRFTAPPPAVGSVGRLVWTVSKSALPANFLSQRDEQLGVLVVNGNQAQFVPIADAREGRPAVVGLDPATLIITEGRHALQDGDAISIRE